MEIGEGIDAPFSRFDTLHTVVGGAMIHGVIHFACGGAFPFLNREAAEEIALFKKKISAIIATRCNHAGKAANKFGCAICFFECITSIQAILNQKYSHCNNPNEEAEGSDGNSNPFDGVG